MRIINKNAFTLIELMVACLIVSVLVGLAVPSYMNVRLRAEEQKAIVTLHAFSKAQKSFWFDHTGNIDDPHTYCSVIADLSAYVEMVDDDGDWLYMVTDATDTTFEIEARHQNPTDGLDLTINHLNQIDRVGAWPY